MSDDAIELSPEEILGLIAQNAEMRRLLDEHQWSGLTPTKSGGVCPECCGPKRHRQSHQGMKGRADQDVERRPRQVADRDQAAAGDETPDGVEIPDDLQPVVIRSGDRGMVHAAENLLAHRLVEGFGHPRQQPAAHDVDGGLHHQQHHRDQQQADQRRDAAAGQHAVIGLQHEDRTDQHQEIDQGARARRRQECGPNRVDRGAQLFGLGRKPELETDHRVLWRGCRVMRKEAMERRTRCVRLAIVSARLSPQVGTGGNDRAR